MLFVCALSSELRCVLRCVCCVAVCVVLCCVVALCGGCDVSCVVV